MDWCFSILWSVSSAHSQLRYQNDADLEVLRRRLSNAPRPLKKRSSITEPEGPQGPNIQKLLYQRWVPRLHGNSDGDDDAELMKRSVAGSTRWPEGWREVLVRPGPDVLMMLLSSAHLTDFLPVLQGRRSTSRRRSWGTWTLSTLPP